MVRIVRVRDCIMIWISLVQPSKDKIGYRIFRSVFTGAIFEIFLFFYYNYI